ncbi:MAG TPA: KEOPS complex N(6)-L-threonylcarbamoyladenine synthase Kae1 [Candidatus Acidoferrales bacterium]|nr:KEOPS complex N(6)-L-threonylcarbamoyladenine synthase Kae1 [Candidatus Acidoferrales bacterium]
MAVMGIECSAHTLGIGVVDAGKVLSNRKSMFPIGNKGLIPARVSDFHAKNVRSTVRAALKAAGLKMSDIEAVGYTKGPGLGPCLRIGQVAALAISESYGVPIYPVNHGVAHIEVAKHMGKMRDPLALYVSGGNSQILALDAKSFPHYHIYGETFDIGVGNMLDSFAREAKLNPSWGSTVAKVATGGRYFTMPYTVKGMDFTFSGLLTNAVRSLKGHKLADVAYSLQETAFSMLCEATERALLLTGKREIVLCGGVAQSARLQEMVKIVAGDHKALFYVAPNEFNSDNGAMIALVAEKMMDAQMTSKPSDCTIDQKYRIDGVGISWK